MMRGDGKWLVRAAHDEQAYSVVTSNDGGPTVLGCRFVAIEPHEVWNRDGADTALSFRFVRITDHGSTEIKVRVPTEDVLKDLQKRLEAALAEMRFDGGVETKLEVGPTIR